MKLRNKRTGEIGKLHCDMNVSPAKYGVFEDTDIRGHYWEYHSLAELNKEWEDYEEPEEDFWYIDSDCETYGVSRAFNQNDSDDVLFNKSIGNYFETKEEAEKAVEKLKAWKRLKEKGFRFCSWFYDIENQEIKIKAEFKEFEEVIVGQKRQDLDLLFGGEE